VSAGNVALRERIARRELLTPLVLKSADGYLLAEYGTVASR
jgi:hypothetical protein